MFIKKELPVITKTSRMNYLKVTQQRDSRECDYLLLHVLKKFWCKLSEDVDSAETCRSKIIERIRNIYKYKPTRCIKFLRLDFIFH